MRDELIWQALQLLLYGMGIVFLFLVVLVYLTHAMSSIARIISKVDTETGGDKSPVPGSGTAEIFSPDDIPEQTKIIIQLAIKQYRQRKYSW